MKIAFLLLSLAGFCSAIQAQTGATANKQADVILTLKETSYDFGKIPQGRPVTHEFELINSGKDTLKLEDVQASCGCTTPLWKTDPVMPGKSTKIQVGFNAVNEGSFEKSVNIFYNGGLTKSVIIKGNVYKIPATSAPVNASIKLLKQAN